jgi:hypothetical protein
LLCAEYAIFAARLARIAFGVRLYAFGIVATGYAHSGAI